MQIKEKFFLLLIDFAEMIEGEKWKQLRALLSLAWAGATVHLAQPRVTEKKSLNVELSRPGWPVGKSVEGLPWLP